MTLLAIHPGALGDVVLFGHVLRAMGSARTLVAGGEKATLLAGLGCVERGLAFDALPMHEAFGANEPCGAGGTPAPRRLSEWLTGHERLVSCFAADSPAAQTKLAALAGVTVARFLPVRPPADFPNHLLELWGDLLGVDVTLRPTPWPVPPTWREQAKATLHGRDVRATPDAGQTPAPRGLAVLHPGSGGRAKCWPMERFAALSRRLARAGIRVAWSLGPVELDSWPTDLLTDLRRNHVVFDNTPLPLLAGLLAHAAVFVGNDSGVAHLAAAVGAPTVALFGPSNPTHFHPVGPTVRVIAKPTLETIHPDEVAEAIEMTRNKH